MKKAVVLTSVSVKPEDLDRLRRFKWGYQIDVEAVKQVSDWEFLTVLLDCYEKRKR